jgi:hypothetical protein
MNFQPAAFNLADAAAYCALSVPTFEKVCPVKPIAFTDSTRGNRYLRVRLDEWLLTLDPNGAQPVARRFGERLSGRSEVA